MNLNERLHRLSKIDHRLNADSIQGQQMSWADCLPGLVPEKIETETQKLGIAKQASKTIRRIIEGDLDMPPSPDPAVEEESIQEKAAGKRPATSGLWQSPNTDEDEDGTNPNDFGWSVHELPHGLSDGLRISDGLCMSSHTDSPHPEDAGDGLEGVGAGRVCGQCSARVKNLDASSCIQCGYRLTPILHKSRAAAGTAGSDSDGNESDKDKEPSMYILDQEGLPEEKKQDHRGHQETKINHMDECCEWSCSLLCGGFPRSSPFRKACFAIYKSRAFDLLFQIVWLANVVFIAIDPDRNQLNLGIDSLQSMSPTDLAASGFNVFCVLVLSVEVMSGIIALGFIRGETSWLTVSIFHRLDLIILLSCFVEAICASLGLRAPTLRPVRLLRVFKNVTLMKLLKGFEVILLTLHRASGQIITMALICVFYFAIFCIVGIAIYQNSFRRACVVCDTQCTQLFLSASGYPMDISCKYWDVSDTSMGLAESDFKGLYPVDTSGRYHTCQLDDFRRQGAAAVKTECRDVGNPMGGYMHFDDAGGGFMVILQVSIPDGHYEILSRALQSEPTVAKGLTPIFFAGLISAFFTFMQLGLFLAVITNAYNQVKSEEDTRRFSNAESLDNAVGISAQNRVHLLLDSHAFHFLMYSAVILQVGALACEGYAMEYARSVLFATFGDLRVLHYVQIAVSIFFGFEILLWFLQSGLSIRKFARTTGNLFWLLILILSSVGIILVHPDVLALIGPRYRTPGLILKAIASLRMYRLMKFLPTLNHILLETVSTLQSIFSVAVFLFLCNFCTAVIGRYLIGNGMQHRSHFADLQQAMLTSFQIFSTDSWTAILYDAMTSGTSSYHSFLNGMFVVIWLTFSYLVIGNIFISTIVAHIKVAKTMEDIRAPGMLHKAQSLFHRDRLKLLPGSAIMSKVGASLNSISLKQILASDNGQTHQGSSEQQNRRHSLHSSDHSHEAHGEDMEAHGYSFPELRAISYDKMSTRLKEVLDIVQGSLRDLDANSPEKRESPLTSPTVAVMRDTTETVLCGFTDQFILRKISIYLDKNPIFEFIIYSVIFASCVLLVMFPQYPDIPGTSPLIQYSTAGILNAVFTLIFLFEFMVRAMARGFVNTKNAYLSSGWNQMDFIILCLSLIDLIGVVPNAGASKAIRSARILSPLRAIKHNEGMIILIEAFIATLKPVYYVLIYTFITYFVFSLVGMSLFGGLFFRCSTKGPGVEYPGGKAQCSGAHMMDMTFASSHREEDAMATSIAYMVPRSWENPPFHFDTFTYALLTITRMGTMKYVPVMYNAMDSTFVNSSPQESFSWSFCLFFVIFLIIGSLFIVNIIIAFTLDGINANQGRTEADLMFISFSAHLKTVENQRKLLPPARNQISTFLRVIINTQYFKTFSAACIAINAIFMLTDHSDASPQYRELLLVQNYVFFSELVFEVALRFAADGPRRFFTDKWNVLDTLIAIGLALSYAIADSSGRALGHLAKGLRMARILRLMLFFRPIRVVFDTLIISLPQLINVSVLMFLVLFIFAMLGTSLYSETKFQAKLGPHSNFRSFSSSSKLIYQILVGEEWQDLMTECWIQPPYCTQRFDGYEFGDCGFVSITPFYFISLKVLCDLMILNLLVGMILDNLSAIMNSNYHKETDDWHNGVSLNQVQEVAAVFNRFDAGTGKIPLGCIRALLHTMPQPLGFRNKENVLVFGQKERAIELLIRSELNVIAKGNMEQIVFDRNKSRREFTIIKLAKLIAFGQPPRNRFSVSVDFAQVIMTLLAWRTPWLLPIVSKRERVKLVGEVMVTAHALTILDFMKSISSRRAKQKILKDTTVRSRFMVWARDDPHYTRRTGLRNDWTSDFCRANPMYTGPIGTVIPRQVLVLDMFKQSQLPRGTLLHREALDWEGLSRVDPADGLQLFLRKVPENTIILKFIDLGHAENGLVTIDFPSGSFEGWKMRSLRKDCLLEPPVRQALSTKPTPWCRLDLQLSIKESKSPTPSHSVGTLIDVHGFVGEDATEGFPVKTVAPVRFNVTKAFVHALNEGDPDVVDDDDVDDDLDFEDGLVTVLQVVGYLRRKNLPSK